jgi:hypothetical protein
LIAIVNGQRDREVGLLKLVQMLLDFTMTFNIRYIIPGKQSRVSLASIKPLTLLTVLLQICIEEELEELQELWGKKGIIFGDSIYPFSEFMSTYLPNPHTSGIEAIRMHNHGMKAIRIAIK